MEGMPGTYTIDVTRRYRIARTRANLTSPVLMSVFLIAFIVASVSWLVLVISSKTAQLLMPLALSTSGIAGGMLHMFVYASTSIRYKKIPSTTTELISANNSSKNISQACTTRLVRIIGDHMHARTQEEMEAILHDLLKTGEAEQVLSRLQLDRQKLYQHMREQVVPNMTWGQLAHTTLSHAAQLKREHIGPLDMISAFLLHPKMHTFLRNHRLQEKDVSFVIWWHHKLRDAAREKRQWWKPEQLLSFTGVGLSWTAGFTPLIDRFARIPQGNLWDLPFGHIDQVEQLINTLARQRQSNVLLVGQPGVGRLGVIKEMARRVHKNKAHPQLNGQRVVYIHLGQLLSFGSSGSEQLSIVSKALTEMEKAGNIIAVLDGMGSILGKQGEGGASLNLTDVILPFFQSSAVRVVTIMSNDEYHLRIKTNEEMLHLFEVVYVPPLDEHMTLQLLAITARARERISEVYLPYATLREVVTSTSELLPYIPFPEKAFDILEEAIVQARGQGQSVVTPEDIQGLISRKIGVDVGKIRESEQEHLLELEDIIHKRVVNQKNGVAAVSRAMIRARAGVRNKKRPIGTFLFLGPTGVGKTETAKALAQAYFGSDTYVQRLDMSEFRGEDGVARLIGDANQPTGQLTSTVADHPFSVILLDEFEKADRLVKQIFLPVFDEGYITDARGTQYSFSHTIIIATSNAGAEYIRTNVGEHGEVPEKFDEQLREHILQQNLFRPETLNRFDGVITFTPLTVEHVKKIAGIMLRKLNKRLDEQHGVTVDITEELVNFLAEIGYDPEFGARPMARAIQDTVEYVAARKIIQGALQPGQKVTIPIQELQSAAEKA